MFKFVVLAAVVAIACGAPAPGFLHGGYGLPAATSYSSRVDIHHSKPIVASYAAPIIKTVVAEPIVTKTIVAEPIHSYSAPLVSSYGYGHGLGLDHGYGGYGLGGLSYGHGYGYGLGHGLGYGHGW